MTHNKSGLFIACCFNTFIILNIKFIRKWGHAPTYKRVSFVVLTLQVPVKGPLELAQLLRSVAKPSKNQRPIMSF